jgi:ATP-binding cassette subfamily B protein
MQRCLAVSHKSHLFKGSVRENLLIAAPDASDQQLQAVLAQVCLWDFFCGLDGLDTAIAEGGANLSGGQQQRFAFARALLYQASLYIFDEVTSNIDVESELIIRDLINGLAQTATVVLISHRLANVCACGCIYVLERGELVAQGSHDDLSQRPGLYQELWNQQQELERCYPVGQAADGAAEVAGAGAAAGAGADGAAGTGAAGAVAAAGAAAAEVYVDGVRGDSHTAGAGAPNVASADGAAAPADGAAAGHASTKPTAGDAPATGGKSADRPSAGAGTGAAAGQRRPWTIALRLLKLVRPLTPVMLAAIAMGIIGFLAAIAIPVVGVLGMLEALGSQAFAGIIAVLALCAVLRGFFRYAEQFLNHYIAFKLLALIRSHVFGALRRLAPAKLETRDKGDLVATITADIELLEIFYAHTVSPVAIAVIVSLVMTIAIGFCHPLLALVALAAYLVVGAGLPLLITKLSRSPGRQYRIGFGALSSYVLEGLRNLPEVIQFGIGGERLAEVDRRTEALVHTARKLKHREGVGAALGGAAIILFSLLMLVVAWLLYGSGAIGFPAVLVATVAMLSSFGPVTALVGLASNLAHTFAAGDRVLDILDEQPQTTEIVTGSEPGFTGVQYLDVSFSYNDSPVLSGISLEIARGGIVGICGRSGSGKSTILRLLMRFWDVGSGSIRISGVGIAGITTQHLRQIEGFVTQTTHLFSGSIEDNLRVAKLDASADELESACRKASIHDAISAMPQGYQTRLAELGEGLSGGEQQRIGLARAFLHDAPLLLLDEPTSNLDSLNEAIILACLSKEAQSRTVVLVSHRRSTLGVADAVYTLEQGRLVSGMS